MAETRADRGSVTVPVAVGLLALLTIVGLAIQLAVVAGGRQRAEIAADLSALAAATRLLQGPEVGCGAAREVAVANGAVLLSCEWSGWDVRVETQLTVGLFGGSVIGRARAGPDGPGF